MPSHRRSVIEFSAFKKGKNRERSRVIFYFSHDRWHLVSIAPIFQVVRIPVRIDNYARHLDLLLLLLLLVTVR